MAGALPTEPELQPRLDELRSLLENAPDTVARRRPETLFRKVTFAIFKPHELEEAQHGYSFNPLTGEDLTSGAGGWRRSWVVIGADEDLGDPLFVDISDERLPVYTAAHGQGDWDPSRFARSARTLLRA